MIIQLHDQTQELFTWNSNHSHQLLNNLDTYLNLNKFFETYISITLFGKSLNN